MNHKEKATIIYYHRHRIAEHKDGTAKDLGWKGEESQQKRYEVISSLCDFNNSSSLDIGCGYGDLKAFLDQKFSNFIYLGIDQMPEFVDRCIERYAGFANTHFLPTDFSTA